MSRATFIRICAAGAILGGLLRAFASFVPEKTPGIYGLYFAVDLFLLFGAIGLFRTRVGEGLLGLFGCALMFLALLILIARDVGAVPAEGYAVGAALFSLGLDLFGIRVLRNRGFPAWIALAWIFSTVLGSIGFFMPGLRFLFTSSGLLFGFAFAAAGIVMWRRG